MALANVYGAPAAGVAAAAAAGVQGCAGEEGEEEEQFLLRVDNGRGRGPGEGAGKGPGSAAVCGPGLVLRIAVLSLMVAGCFLALFDVNVSVQWRWRAADGAPPLVATTAGFHRDGGATVGAGSGPMGSGGGLRGQHGAPAGAGEPRVADAAGPQALPPSPPGQRAAPAATGQPLMDAARPQRLEPAATTSLQPQRAEAPPQAPPPAAPAARYIMASTGSSACPPGTGPLADHAACRAAASFFGIGLAYPDEPHEEERDPSGCVFRVPDQDAYFNSHPAGGARPDRRPICSAAGGAAAAAAAPSAAAPPAKAAGKFVMGERGSSGCPAGSMPIADLEGCRDAAGFFGKVLIYSEPHEEEKDPRGCVFRVPDQDLYFNSHPQGAEHDERRPVCGDLPPAAPASAPAAAPAPGPPPPATGLSVADFVFGSVNSVDCPGGARPLPDAAACEAAAAVLGKGFLGDQMEEQWADPAGCVFRVPDQDLYFNSHPVGAPHEQRRPVCSTQAPGKPLTTPAPPQVDGALVAEAAAIKVFCFAWTPLRPVDEQLLPEVRLQYEKCDGHAFFTDEGATSSAASAPDVVRVPVPAQSTARADNGWLYHRNMVGVLPSWSHLLASSDLDAYDWVLHSELDHFVSPARVRLGIAGYLQTLRTGSTAERRSVDGAMMLMWGNAFLFSRKMLQEMRRQWSTFGQPADASTIANGCPSFMRGRMEWPEHCSQDIVYPSLVDLSVPRIPAYGRSGCGQFDARNGRGKPFPPGCWEMQKNPMGMTEDGEMDAIREFALVQNMKDKEEAKQHYAGTAQAANWELWYMAKAVPVIHHVNYPSVHKLARELLRP